MRRTLILVVVIAWGTGSVAGAERQRASRRADKQAQKQPSQSQPNQTESPAETGDPGATPTVVLTLHKPGAAPIPALSLWTPPIQRQTGDALAHYQKAMEILLGSKDNEQLRALSRQALVPWPTAEVTALLDRYQPALKALNAGQSCRDCQWPPVSNTSTIDLKSYRYATWLLCVQARHAMTQGQYAQAVNTLKMGFELAQHLAQGPSLIQGLVAVAMASSVCEQIETLIQQSEAPSLFAALRTLPQPFITLGPQMQAEIDNLDHHPQVNALNRGTFETQLTDTHSRIRLLTDNLARRLALLQTIEALRNYMADHEGQWPPSLTQLGPLSTPNDPVTEKPFQYQHSGNTATLKGPMPQNGRAKDALHYELTLE